MRDVVIIGGGLSGLAAASELEKLKVPYRMIEVKKRLGGSIASEQRDGFIVDNGLFAFPAADDFSFLNELGLNDALFRVHDGRDRDTFAYPSGSPLREWVAFKSGTQTLSDALARPLTGTVLHKMAVSSVGSLQGRFTICLENGLMLDTGALIVATPARYVERMFRTLQPDISQRLMSYHYDTITRVTLGFRREDIDLPPSLPWDMAVAFYWWTDDPQRVPENHVMMHLGLRTPLPFAASDSLLKALFDHLPTRAAPVFSQMNYWPEADPLPPHSRDFNAKMTELQNLLPEGVAMVGSDFNGLSLAARIGAGRAAAQKIAHWLESK